eukprot:gene6939-7599_t
MSKNTRTDGFRRTDIDKFDEDKFKQETDAVEFDSSEVEAKKKESIALLNSQKKTDALRTLLSSPPLSYHSPQLQSVKTEYLKAVLDVLGAFKMSEIPGAVKELSEDDCDMLMKYLYRGMEYLSRPRIQNAQEAEYDEQRSAYAGNLLTWHKHTTELAGVGCIVRVLADRKTV